MYFKSIVLTIFVTLMVISPVLAADDTNQSENPWYWYNQAVDLANAGHFTAALQANEKALALNQSIPLAWANEAGILVQLGRYDDAIKAADVVLSINNTQLPNTYAAAYYSKGDALSALGKTSEAQDAYIVAHQLDSTLPIPKMPSVETIPGTTVTTIPSQNPMVTQGVQQPATTTRTPLSPIIVIGALMITGIFCWRRT
jgi:tetratricopeptide (TPR) repeat protein